MTTFEKALKFTLRWEGGYADVPGDPGGATNKGITQGTYDMWRRKNGLQSRPVRGITNLEVHRIYKEFFWDRCRCEELEPKLGIALFDWAVNTGSRRAVRHLQEVVGSNPDGIIGPRTLSAISKQTETHLVNKFLRRRRGYYYAISGGRLRKFLKGWINRLNSLKQYLTNLPT